MQVQKGAIKIDKKKIQEATKQRLIEELLTCQKYKTMLSIGEGRISLLPSSINLFNHGIELELPMGTEKNNIVRNCERIKEKLDNYIYHLQRIIIEGDN